MADLSIRDYAVEVVVDYTPPTAKPHEICVPGQYGGEGDAVGEYGLTASVEGSFHLGHHHGHLAVAAQVVPAEFGTDRAVPGSIPECDD